MANHVVYGKRKRTRREKGDEFKLIGFGARRGRNHGGRANMDLDVPIVFMTSCEALEKSQGAY